MRAPNRAIARLLCGCCLFAAVASAQGSHLEVAVVDAGGAKAPDTTVQVLWSAEIHLGGRHESLVTHTARTNKEGVASIPLAALHQHVCLHAFTETHAVFLCHHPLTHSGDHGVTLTLETALFLKGRIVDEKGKPVSGAKARAIVAGGYEMHGIDAAVDDKGNFKLPPMPRSLLQDGEPELQVRREGYLPYVQSIGTDSDDRPMVVRLQIPRSVQGRIVDEKGAPVHGARIVTTEEQEVVTGADGRFEIGPVATR
ncbi:MAG: carboxypeptidase-like regulatory domain-containing protein, partial [Planctomycetota bacterium]